MCSNHLCQKENWHWLPLLLFRGEKQGASWVSEKHRTLGQLPLSKACATLPTCVDQLETKNPDKEPGVGALLNTLWPACGAEPGNPLALGPRLSPASQPRAAEGQGQGPGWEDV